MGQMQGATSRTVTVDGIRTHYFEGGAGEPLVLLHSGEFGGCAEFSWERNVAAFAAGYRVIAPDWLGFGETDKVYDFVDPRGRMVDHMARFLQAVDAADAHFVGNSMGAGYLIREVAAETPRFRPRSMVVVSAGGFMPDNEHRRTLQTYDGSREAMRALLRAAMEDPRWAEDEDYVERRWQRSRAPGAWECIAAARFRAPFVELRGVYGHQDVTVYERIACPTLIVAGARDKLREPGYTDAFAPRISGSRVHVFPDAGHCANIEEAEAFNALVLDFLAGIGAGDGRS